MNVLDNINVSDLPPSIPLQPLMNQRLNASSSGLHLVEPIYVIVCSRDLEEEELELLKTYGKILKYDDCHINIPLEQLIASDNVSYIIFDVRIKSHRMAMAKETTNHHFHVIAIIHKWEEMDDFIDDANCENALCSFPPKQAFKKDFDKLLLEKKIRKPSCFKNVIRIFFRTIGGWQKQH